MIEIFKTARVQVTTTDETGRMRFDKDKFRKYAQENRDRFINSMKVTEKEWKLKTSESGHPKYSTFKRADVKLRHFILGFLLLIVYSGIFIYIGMILERAKP